MEEPIYPMAFKPNTKIKCKLYFVGFPKTWKEKLIKIEKIINTNWNETYSLPTGILNSSLKIWMDGVIEVAMLRAQSKDEDWLISYEREVNTKILLDHIKTWLSSYYLSNDKLTLVVKEEVRNLMKFMNSEELDKLQRTEEVKLFDSQGIPIESYSYTAFPLMIINQLVGKKIEINGQMITLNYSGKNQLISDIQKKGQYIYSYDISFSLQTIPPNREPLLLCDCCIHRWIVGIRRKPYFNKENIVAHIWSDNNKIYKIPIQQKYKQGEQYFWQELEQNYYNLYQPKTLPKACEVIDDLEYYLSSDTKITCLYKNGMDSNGFKKSQVGTGVSMSDRNDICKGVARYISELVFPIENVENVKSTKEVRAELKEVKEVKVEVKEVRGELKEVKVEKAINFNQELTDKQKAILTNRLKKCIKSPTLNFEIYYNDSSEDCAKEILEKFKEIFQSNEEIEFKISLCPLGNIGEPLENKTSSAITKRINEIQKEVELATELTACIILLPDKEAFERREFDIDNQSNENSNQKADPKDAIRCGFALKNRLTQFIVPWNESDLKENNKKELNEGIDSKIVSAIEDLCRQLGYIKEMETGSKKDKLMDTHVIGIHIMQIKKTSGKVSLLPLCVELDYISGEVYVECDAFEHPKVLYREAAFELARLSRDKNLEKKCTHAMEEMLRQKMMRWQDIYEEKACLVLIESNKTTRNLYPGITDIQIQQYHCLKPYCPEEINVGTKENSYKLNLNDSKLRFIRLRVNKEVPNYYTKLSTKKEGYVATKGVFKYKQVYWAIARRPNNSAYKLSYKETRYSKPSKYFAARDMIEIYPIQLQKDDNPDEWVHYTNSLRLGAIQYDEATIVPLPLHLAKKLQEYILTT